MKKTVLTSVALLVLLGMFGCNKGCCGNIYTQLAISYQTAKGENLFEADTTFRVDQIKIYYKVGESFKYMYNPMMDAPRYYRIDSNSFGPYIMVFPSEHYSGNYSTTLIQLNDTIVDTLVARFTFAGESIYLNGGFYNGQTFTDRSIIVVK